MARKATKKQIAQEKLNTQRAKKERKRIKGLQKALATLKSRIPTLAKEKRRISKLKTIKLAMLYILYLKKVLDQYGGYTEPFDFEKQKKKVMKNEEIDLDGFPKFHHSASSGEESESRAETWLKMMEIWDLDESLKNLDNSWMMGDVPRMAEMNLDLDFEDEPVGGQSGLQFRAPLQQEPAIQGHEQRGQQLGAQLRQDRMIQGHVSNAQQFGAQRHTQLQVATMPLQADRDQTVPNYRYNSQPLCAQLHKPPQAARQAAPFHKDRIGQGHSFNGQPLHEQLHKPPQAARQAAQLQQDRTSHSHDPNSQRLGAQVQVSSKRLPYDGMIQEKRPKGTAQVYGYNVEQLGAQLQTPLHQDPISQSHGSNGQQLQADGTAPLHQNHEFPGQKHPAPLQNPKDSKRNFWRRQHYMDTMQNHQLQSHIEWFQGTLIAMSGELAEKALEIPTIRIKHAEEIAAMKAKTLSQTDDDEIQIIEPPVVNTESQTNPEPPLHATGKFGTFQDAVRFWNNNFGSGYFNQKFKKRNKREMKFNIDLSKFFFDPKRSQKVPQSVESIGRNGFVVFAKYFSGNQWRLVDPKDKEEWRKIHLLIGVVQHEQAEEGLINLNFR